LALAHRDVIAEFKQSDTVERLLRTLSDQWPKISSLPAGNIHADYFPDNVFFNDGWIAGVIDFYFACRDTFAYDLMLAVNAWCFDGRGAVLDQNIASFFKGYETIRPLTETERSSLPLLGQAAALRIALTRFRDWHKAAGDNGHFTPRDPMAYMRIIEFYQNPNIKGLV